MTNDDLDEVKNSTEETLTMDDDTSTIDSPSSVLPERWTGNAKVTLAYSKPLIHDIAEEDNFKGVTLPSIPIADSVKALTAITNEIDQLPEPQARAVLQDPYYSIAFNGHQRSCSDESYQKTIKSVNRSWVQEVVHDAIKLTPRLTNPVGNAGKALSGRHIKQLAAASLGQGGYSKAPMWDSRFWVEFNPPDETDILALYDEMSKSIDEIGRITWGAAFSSLSGLLIQSVVNAAIANVKSISVELPAGMTKEQFILDHLLITDYPALLWGFACAMYPNGFTYHRACLNTEKKCTRIVSEVLDLLACFYVDESRLTERHISFMADRKAGSVSYDNYIKAMDLVDRVRGFDLSPKCKINFKTPNLRQFFEATHQWVDDVRESLSATQQAESESVRKGIVTRHTNLTVLRQFSPWVFSIEAQLEANPDQRSLLKKPGQINAYLSVLSRSNKAKTRFSEVLFEYYESQVLSTIAIPSYECPDCGMIQETQGGTDGVPPTSLKEIIPLDVLYTFFDLAGRRDTLTVPYLDLF